MLQEITESTDFLGKNWCRPATLLQPNSFTGTFQTYVFQTF